MQDFRPKNKAYSNLLTRPRPIKEIDLVSYIASSDGFEAFIHREVLSQIYGDAERAAPDETIGLLAGRVWRDELGPYTLVLGVEGASKDEIDATPSHVRISGYGLSQVRQRLETNYPSMEIVGWYHSHPEIQGAVQFGRRNGAVYLERPAPHWYRLQWIT